MDKRTKEIIKRSINDKEMKELFEEGEIRPVELNIAGRAEGFWEDDTRACENVDMKNFVAVMPIKPYALVIEARLAKGMQSGDCQRGLDIDRCKMEIAPAHVSFDGGTKSWRNLNLNFTVAVTSDVIVKNGKKTYLLVPITRRAANAICEFYNIVDGQHSAYSESDMCSLLRNEYIDLIKGVDIYVDTTPEQRIELFNNKNGKVKPIRAAQIHNNEILMGHCTEEQREFYNMLRELNEQRINIGDGISRKSSLYGHVKFEEFRKTPNPIDPLTLMKQTMYNEKGYNKKGWAVRDTNLQTELKRTTAINGSTQAATMIQHELAFNEVHGKDNPTHDLDMFSTSKAIGIGSATKACAAMAMAEGHLYVLNELHLDVNIENLIKVIDLSRELVFGGASFANFDAYAVSGGSNSHKETMRLVKEIKNKCIEYVDKFGIEKLTMRNVRKG